MTLDVQALLSQAQSRTGLREFGEESFREPLARLVDSVNHESQLSAFGRLAFSEVIVHALANRLEVEDWYKRHPEIDEQEIVAPVFIVGFPRTGSTLLSYLLALDPQTRVLRQWESEKPCPPPIAGEHNDPRVGESEARHDQFVALMPDLVPMVPYGGAAGPVECYEIFYMTFDYPHFDMYVHCPTFTKWICDAARDHRASYRYHKRVLKLLQWRCPPKRWALKMPSHSLMIDSLYEIYPDARFIMTHRDPVKVIPSTVHLNVTVRNVHLENPLIACFGESVMTYWDTAMRRLLAFRKSNERCFFDVYHGRQLADSATQMRNLYHWLGWPLTQNYLNAVAEWRNSNPKRDNRFDMAQYGLNPELIRERFAYYTSRFPSAIAQ